MTAEEVKAAREKGQKIQAGAAAYVPPTAKSSGSAAGPSTGLAVAMALPNPDTLTVEQMGVLVQQLKQMNRQELDSLPQLTKKKVLDFLQAHNRRSSGQ